MSRVRYEDPSEEDILEAANAAAEDLGEEYSQDKHGTDFGKRIVDAYNQQNDENLPANELPYPAQPIRLASARDLHDPREENSIEDFYQQAEDGKAYLLFTGLHEEFRPGQADVAEMIKTRVQEQDWLQQEIEDAEEYFQELEDELNAASGVERFDPVAFSVQEVPFRLEDAEKYTQVVKLLEDKLEYLNMEVEDASLAYTRKAESMPDLRKRLDSKKVDLGQTNHVQMKLNYREPGTSETTEFKIGILGEGITREDRHVLTIPRYEDQKLNGAMDFLESNLEHLDFEIERKEQETQRDQ